MTSSSDVTRAWREKNPEKYAEIKKRQAAQRKADKALRDRHREEWDGLVKEAMNGKQR